jgi:hypothetical protein
MRLPTAAGTFFKKIWEAFGPIDFDRFAAYHHVQRHPQTGSRVPYNSLFADEGSAAASALHQNWTGVLNYAVPPTVLIPHVLNLIKAARCKCVRVAPEWASQAWWPLMATKRLKARAKAVPMALWDPRFFTDPATQLRRFLRQALADSSCATYGAQCSQFDAYTALAGLPPPHSPAQLAGQLAAWVAQRAAHGYSGLQSSWGSMPLLTERSSSAAVRHARSRRMPP